MEFAQFVLELIENPPETDVDEQIPDLFLTLLLAYNLQFEDPYDNILLNGLETRDIAKTFCEKVLLLLNREGKMSAKMTRQNFGTLIFESWSVELQRLFGLILSLLLVGLAYLIA